MTSAVRLNVFGEAGEITKEALNAPWWVLKRFSQGVKKDAMRIKKAGIPGAIFGLPLAAITLPLTPLTVPSAIAARASAASDSPIGKTVAGIGGFVFGVALTGWFAEAAIGLHVCEVLSWSGQAYERVEKKRAAKLLREGNEVLQAAEEQAAA